MSSQCMMAFVIPTIMRLWNINVESVEDYLRTMRIWSNTGSYMAEQNPGCVSFVKNHSLIDQIWENMKECMKTSDNIFNRGLFNNGANQLNNYKKIGKYNCPLWIEMPRCHSRFSWSYVKGKKEDDRESTYRGCVLKFIKQFMFTDKVLALFQRLLLSDK